MSRFLLDARRFSFQSQDESMPMGDCCEQWAFLAMCAKAGDSIAVNCTEKNKSVFEFQRDYCQYTENLEVLVDSTMKGEICLDEDVANFPVWERDRGGSPMYPLRRPLEPIVAPAAYLCFQTEASAHQKYKKELRSLVSCEHGYSVGMNDEWVMPGTEAFHSRSWTDVARLLNQSIGVVGVLSSVALFGALLGKFVVSVGYDGRQPDPARGISSMRPPRVVFENGNVDAIVRATNMHFSGKWVERV